MRLQKYLSQAGYTSRRQAEELIKQGKVYVNDKQVTTLGTKVQPEDKVKVGNKQVELPTEKTYLMMNKPIGYITTKNDPQNRKTVIDLLPKKYHHLNPVGRLDKQSSGLLLFTNDGDLANQLTHPKHEHQKKYKVKIDKPIKQSDITLLKKGISFPEGLAKADQVKKLKPNLIIMTLHQGYKRQIRRMLKELGYHTLELQRIELGKFKISTIGERLCLLVQKKDIV